MVRCVLSIVLIGLLGILAESDRRRVVLLRLRKGGLRGGQQSESGECSGELGCDHGSIRISAGALALPG